VSRAVLAGLSMCATLSTATVAAPPSASAAPELRVFFDRSGETSPGVVPEPAECIGPLSRVDQLVTLTNRDDVPVPASFSTVLDLGLHYEAGTCTADVGMCSVVNPLSVEWSGTIDAHGAAHVSFPFRVDSDVPAGTFLCETFTVTFDGEDPFMAVVCIRTNSARQCGVGAPAVGTPGLAMLIVLMLLGGGVAVRRRAARADSS
jgi:hypothetical protein